MANGENRDILTQPGEKPAQQRPEVQVTKINDLRKNVEDETVKQDAKITLKELDAHRKRTDELKKWLKKGNLKEECQKKYAISVGENATVQDALAALAQANKPGFEQWNALTYQNNTSEALHGPMMSIYTLFADSDFSGEVVDLPDVGSKEYKNRWFTFGRGVRKHAKDQASSDRIDLIAPTVLIGYMQDALASIKMQKGCDDTTAQTTLCENIASIIGLQGVTTPEGLFNAIKQQPQGLCTFYSTIALAGPDMRTMFVEGKGKGMDALIKEQEQKQKVTNALVTKQLQQAEGEKAQKEANEIAPEVQQQIDDAALTAAQKCKQAYIEHFQRLIQEAPSTEEKKTLLDAMKEQLGDQKAFTEKLHTHLVNVFMVHVKDVVTTVGAGNSITIADIARQFGKEGIAGRANKISFTFGGGVNTYQGSLKVLNKDTVGRLVGQIGLSYGDEKTLGKRTSIFRGVGAGGAIYAGNMQYAAGAQVGVSHAVNQIDGKDASEVRDIGGKTITKAQASIGGGRSSQGFSRGPSLGVVNDKDEAIAQAKNVVVGEMAKVLAADNPQEEIQKYAGNLKGKDAQTFNQLTTFLTPFLDSLKGASSEQKNQIVAHRTDRLGTLREGMAHQSLKGRVSLKALNLGQILQVGPSPIGLLLIAASAFEKTGRQLWLKDATETENQQAELASGIGAQELMLSSQDAVDGLNDILSLPKGGADSSKSAKYDKIITKENVVGMEFETSVESITLPLSLLKEDGPVNVVADEIAMKYMMSNEGAIIIPKEFVHVQIMHDHAAGRKVTVSLGLPPEAGKAYNKLDANKLPNNPTGLTEYQNELMQLQGIDKVQDAVASSIDTQDAKGNTVKNVFASEGLNFVLDAQGKPIIKTVNGKHSFFVELPADVTVDCTSCTPLDHEGKRYQAMPLDGVYTLIVDTTQEQSLKTLERTEPNMAGELQFIYDKKTAESNNRFFDAELKKVDAEVYKIMIDHDRLMQAKYTRNGDGTKTANFADFRDAIDGNNLSNAQSAARKLFSEGLPQGDALNRENIRALDSALCLISHTQDKSFESDEARNAKINALYKSVASTLTSDGKNNVKALVDTVNAGTALSEDQLRIYQEFISGKYTLAKRKPKKGTTFQSYDYRGSGRYELAWALAPVKEVEIARRASTLIAIKNSMSNVDESAYVSEVWDKLLSLPNAQISTMGSVPSPEEIENYTDPTTTSEKIADINQKYPNAYIAKNGIGMIFGYEGNGSQKAIEPKFVTHPVMVKGLSTPMEDAQAGKRKDRYMNNLEKIAPDLFKQYHDSVLAQLPNEESKAKLSPEIFKNALITGESMVIGDQTINIVPTWKEGFFVQCFNPTILLEGLVTTVTENKDESTTQIPELKCATQPINTVNIGGSALQSHRTSASIGVAGSLVQLKPSKPEVITVTTDSKVVKALEEAKTLLEADGKVFTNENEVFKVRKTFDADQMKEINNYLKTQYGENRISSIDGKVGWQLLMKAFTSAGLTPSDFISQLRNPVTISQLNVLRYDLLKIPYATLVQKFAVIDKQIYSTPKK